MKDTSNRLFCLLGDKVDNSLSPVIHNSFFNYYDISGFYIPLNVSQSNLEDIVLLLNKLNFIDKYKIPKFPISGDYLKKHGYETGEALGKKLKSLEEKWIENNFIIEKKVIDKSLGKDNKN